MSLLPKTSLTLLTGLSLFLAVGLEAKDAALSYKPGRSYTYDYKAQASLALKLQNEDSDGLNNRSMSKVQNCDIRVNLGLVSTLEDGSSLLKMNVIQFDSAGSDGRVYLPLETRAKLGQPIYFVQNADGSIGALYRVKGERPEITNFKRNIIAAFHVEMEEGPSRGNAALGLPVGEISLSRSGSDWVIRKTWDESGLRSQSAPRSLRGEHATHISASEGVIRQVDLNVSMELSPNEDREASQSQTRVNTQSGLRLVSTRRTLIQPSFNARAYEEVGLAMEAVEKEVAPGRMPEKFSDAIRLLRKDPKAADRLGATLQANPNVKGHLDLVSALAQEGSPRSQVALVRDVLQGEGFGGELAQRALLGMMQIRKPQLETLDALLPLLDHADDEIRRAAVTALGSLTGRLDADPAARFLDQLHTYASRPWADMDLMIAIGALGNAGQSSSLNEISNYLQHPSPAVRREAIDALRKLDGDAVKAILLDQAGRDSSDCVRSKALELLNAGVEQDGLRAKKAQKTWNKRLGWGDFNITMSGKMLASQENGHSEVHQVVDGRAWSAKPQITRFEVVSDTPGQGKPSSNYCNGYLLGEKVYASDRMEGLLKGDRCSYSIDKTWDSGPFDVGEINQSYPIYAGIAVNVKASLNGQASVGIKAEANACDPMAIFANCTLSPKVSVNASASAAIVFAGIFDLGLQVEGAIANGSLPCFFELKLANAKDFSGAVKIDLGLDSASFAANGLAIGKTYKIWNYNVPAMSKTLVDYKWPK